jgi:hypothetical protein
MNALIGGPILPALGLLFFVLFLSWPWLEQRVERCPCDRDTDLRQARLQGWA